MSCLLYTEYKYKKSSVKGDLNIMVEILRHCIHMVPIFNHLTDPQLELIMAQVTAKKLAKGDFLYKADDNSHAIYILNKGAIKVFQIVESGKEQLNRILRPGDIIGETGIFNPDAVHEDYAQALIDSTVCVIYQEDLFKILVDYPEVSLRILNELSSRLRQSDKQTTYISTEKVASRLATFLADLIPEENEGETVMLPMAKKEIASYLGTTPETLSRKFKVLEKEGLIQQVEHNKIIIPNIDNLLFYSE